MLLVWGNTLNKIDESRKPDKRGNVSSHNWTAFVKLVDDKTGEELATKGILFSRDDDALCLRQHRREKECGLATQEAKPSAR